MKITPIVSRSVPLIDIEIVRSGDGRTVTAYAATFDDGYEVRDNLYPTPYIEEIDSKAFNRALKGGAAGRAQVIFNHGLTIHGTPSSEFSKPIGTAVEIRAEPKGLVTVTRYAATPLGDEILELIRSGAIRAQSFRGPVFRSESPKRIGDRTVIRRLELGLIEYGPAPFAVNDGAQILAIRSAAQLLDELRDLSPEELTALREILSGPAPQVHADADTHDEPPADEAPVHDGPSNEVLIIEAEQAQRRRHTKES